MLSGTLAVQAVGAHPGHATGAAQLPVLHEFHPALKALSGYHWKFVFAPPIMLYGAPPFSPAW